MKVNQSDKVIISFSSPESMNNTVFVSKVHSDYTTEVIGKIYPKFNSVEDTIYYTSINIQGEELFPPTTDFSEIEKQFEKYAQESSDISLMETMQKEAEKPIGRKESLRAIRNLKIKNLEILKSF
ncbi:MAG: hypothetical protein NTZ33_15520 [Bacteroidetes bacterium]|nr:hypothetical protein [Bacteroidota bacterium]